MYMYCINTYMYINHMSSRIMLIIGFRCGVVDMHMSCYEDAVWFQIKGSGCHAYHD